jgi:uncharacterized protein (TIGR02217 family)
VDGDETAVAVNTSAGRITFALAPEEGAAITAGFLFDCPVRFDTDRLDINLETFGAGRALRVPLIELVG